MESAVCTLFEGHYHYGVAALVNSLSRAGFTGTIYIGYRGTLPPWAGKATEQNHGNATIKVLPVSDNLRLHFILLTTDYQLTNYKPDFMLWLWQALAKNAGAMFYFDPDIVVTAPWSFFENWVTCGVALSEDVNSPLARFHPRRVAWRRYFGEHGVELSFKEATYVNGGFAGVHANDISFLERWKTIQEIMAPAIGGLSRSIFSDKPLPTDAQGPLAPFGRTDQDALNATVEAWNGKVSFAGKDAMAFSHGQVLMPHALGVDKPWLIHPLQKALTGVPPRLADTAFWANINSPVAPYSPLFVKWRKLTLKLSSLLGRFYKR